MGIVLDKLGTDGAECSRRMWSGRKVPGAIRSAVNSRDLQLKCARVLHETLLVPVLTYGSVTVLWNEKERSRIRAVGMDNLRGLFGVRKMESSECTDKRAVRRDKGGRRKGF